MGRAEGTNIDHQGLEVIGPEECWQLLASVPVGRVAFVDAGEPMVLPVNHAVVGHRVVFRTRPGTLLHEALMREPVAFQVDEFDRARRCGWSVLVRGVADLAEDPDTLWSTELDAWADGVERDDWVEIRAEEISGRRIVHGH
jgi:uncharacterized protein